METVIVNKFDYYQYTVPITTKQRVKITRILLQNQKNSKMIHINKIFIET